MTEQEIFDTVWHAMKAQGRRSIKNGHLCMYRSPDGLKCAAGHLISDDEYMANMEGRIFGSESTKAVIEWPEHLLEHLELIQELQRAHDGAISDFWGGFSFKAALAANRYGLTIPENTQ